MSIRETAKRFSPYLKIAVALGLFAFVLRHHDLSPAYLGALATSPLFWLLTLAGNLAVHLLTTLRWQLLLKRSGHSLSFPKCFVYHGAGQFLGLVAFGTLGTDLARAYYSKKEGIPVPALTKVLVLDRAASAAGLFASAGSAYLFVRTGQPLWLWAFLAAFLLSALRPEIFLSIAAHLAKVATVLGIFLLSASLLADAPAFAAKLATALGIEALPISWQGFGLGHFAFSELKMAGAVDLYNAYFLGKTAFKLACGLFLFTTPKRRS